jgi:hypothetical protein
LVCGYYNLKPKFKTKGFDMIKKYKKTRKGYFRFAKDNDGKLRFEHSIIWENNNGKIPLGMQLHHIDFDRCNNDISNLSLVTPIEHKRIHSGCILINGEWEKPCKCCGEYKKINKENWYYSRGYVNGKICKTCFIKKSLDIREKLIKKGWKRKS